MLIEEDYRNCLGLFAKWPEPGRTKTRLAAAATEQWAAEVARAMLDDALDRFSAIEARRMVVYAPADRTIEFGTLAGDAWNAVPQVDGDLGQRMAGFVDQAFRAGAARVVVVGTDSPSMPVGFISQAFQELRSHDVVIGPATDGGYYLIGLSAPRLGYFDGIEWSGPTVLKETFGRVLSGDRVTLLPPWYDVDTPDDWHMLAGHLAALRHVGVDPKCPRTERMATEGFARAS